MNPFKYDSILSRCLTRVIDLLILNFLWIICSLPIITFGAASTALYYSLIKIVRGKDYGITKMFYHSFLQNLKQGCGLTILFLISGIFLYSGIQIYYMIDGTFSWIARSVVVVLLIIWGILFLYVFPLLAQFDDTIKDIIKNAFLISIGNIGKTLMIAIINVVPIVFFFKFPHFFVGSLPIWLLWGFALIALINATMFVKIFDRYITNEEST